jgi:hypothetical protein
VNEIGIAIEIAIVIDNAEGGGKRGWISMSIPISIPIPIPIPISIFWLNDGEDVHATTQILRRDMNGASQRCT